MTLQEAFEILKLPKHADRAQIRHAYSEQSKLYHVETHPEEFGRLHEAYKTALAHISKPETVFSAETSSFEEAVPHRVSPVSRAFDLSLAMHSKTQQPMQENEEETPVKASSSYDDILNQLVYGNTSIHQAHELIQLMYYKCRYEEASPEETDVRSIGNAEIKDDNDIFARMEIGRPEALADGQLFFKTPWSIWKTLDWTALFCHPEFLRNQYDNNFLKELYCFLQQETNEGLDGISQNLYLSLCTAYGLFCDEQCSQNADLETIGNFLRLHPKHQEYLQDLQCWTTLKEAREIVLLCQRAFSFSKETRTIQEQQAFTEEFLDAAEEKLLQEYAPWKNFVFDSLTLLPGTLFSKELPERKKEFEELLKTQEECFEDFANTLLDHRTEGNSLYEYNYQPLACRIEKFRSEYLTRMDWKKIICSPFFVSSFKDRMEPRRGGFVLSCPLIEYELWKELCSWFDGDSPLEKDTLYYLKSSFYFPEYEKWYQQECIWREQHIEESYFNETFPLPELTPGKLELLHTAEQGTLVNVKNIQAVFNNLPGHNEKAFDFLARVTNAMVHFKFLLITPKYEKDPVPGDAFCFLEDGVILYRKKENRTCRLSHQSFYDLISHQIEMIALNAKYSKTGYTGEFIDTVCKNMYYYHCFIDRFPSK